MLEKAKEIKDELKVNNYFKTNQINKDLPIIKPFIGSDKIKLIIIGQDPTVKNKKSREKIAVTLNLDKTNSLRKYIEFICEKSGKMHLNLGQHHISVEKLINLSGE